MESFDEYISNYLRCRSNSTRVLPFRHAGIHRRAVSLNRISTLESIARIVCVSERFEGTRGTLHSNSTCVLWDRWKHLFVSVRNASVNSSFQFLRFGNVDFKVYRFIWIYTSHVLDVWTLNYIFARAPVNSVKKSAILN